MLEFLWLVSFSGSSSETVEEKSSSEEIVDDFVEASGNGSPPLSATPESSSLNGKTPDSPRDVKVEANSKVTTPDDEEDLFGTADNQDSGSKVRNRSIECWYRTLKF